jgi:hypothetical protein
MWENHLSDSKKVHMDCPVMVYKMFIYGLPLPWLVIFKSFKYTSIYPYINHYLRLLVILKDPNRMYNEITNPVFIRKTHTHRCKSKYKSDQWSHVSPHNGQFHVGTSFVTDGQINRQCTTRLGTNHSCKVWIKLQQQFMRRSPDKLLCIWQHTEKKHLLIKWP